MVKNVESKEMYLKLYYFRKNYQTLCSYNNPTTTIQIQKIESFSYINRIYNKSAKI